MAKANRKNKAVSKKDQKKPSTENSLFNGTTIPKNNEDNNLSILEENDSIKEGNIDTELSEANSLSEENHNIKEEATEAKFSVEDVTEANELSEDKVKVVATICDDEMVDDINSDKKKIVSAEADTDKLIFDNTANYDADGSEKLSLEKKEKVGENSGELKEEDKNMDLFKGEQSLSVFDINKAVYVEIHNGNIFHYFSAGLVSPSKYIVNRAFPDLQTINEDFLLLTNSTSNSTNDDLVLLEIDLDGFEVDDTLITENFALLSAPFPVTKIKSIQVRNQTIKNTIVNDALVFNGGFIPENLIQVVKIESQQRFDFKTIKKAKVKDYSLKIDKYDRILGLLAFVRNYDLLISPKSKIFRTLPNHFFYAMQVIDETFGSEIVPKNSISEFYSFLFKDTCPPEKALLKWIFSRVQFKDNFTDVDTLDFGRLLNDVDEDPEILRRSILTHLAKNLDRKRALKVIDESKSKSQLQLYVFAFLRNYGNLNSIDVSRKDIESVFSPNFGEYAFAVLGYFYGYKNLKNTDDRISQSNIISKFITGKPPIKFQLTTRFDYIIIELVYQFVFNEGKFSIGNTKDLREEQLMTKSEDANYRIYETLLYGKLYQNIEFNDPFDKLLEQISKLPEEIPLISDLGIFCHRAKIKIKPVTITDIGSVGSIFDRTFFAKEDLYRYLSENRKNVDIEEIQMRFQLANKANGR